MGELINVSPDQQVLQHVFKQYDSSCKGELNAILMQALHGDLRVGGISLPQVVASIKYACVGDHCQRSELLNLLQEMDRRYYLVQDLRWEFSLIDRHQKDTISEEEARWMVQTVHGKFFSRKKWETFLKSRAIPGSGVAFAEIEVLLCSIPSRGESRDEELELEREREDRLRRQKLLEEEKDRLRKQRDDERRRLEEERQRQQKEKRKNLKEDDDLRKREEEERRRREEEEEQRRLRELEEKQREEEERRKREEEELYKDVETLAKRAEEEEKRAEEELKRHKKEDEERERLKQKHRELRDKKLRYNLKVAIKSRDKYQLEYNITEFKKDKVEDVDMDLMKAEKLLKELTSRDGLKRAMTKREIEELERAIQTVKKHGFEVQLAKELAEANELLVRLRRLERIRHEILELKQSTVAEIRSYQTPPLLVHTIMTATFLILGHKEKETKDWKAVQALVGKTGKESLKRRCLECKPEGIALGAAKRAKTLLNKFELDEVRDVSAGAATFYVFSTTMIEEALDLQEQKNAAAEGAK
ncbi:Reticulocyte binding protein 2-like b [Mizuhopecten yessoensis]|uniref:Reticulocyte binding protein 2-like b n=1 Tax=Mizuhopecten yessoensis TaxID=6573 RepID=A0A210R5P6_MIZYE|nr:Reticulocyte binding protein 2-like b [Mizuhopecten yessoensis]